MTKIDLEKLDNLLCKLNFENSDTQVIWGGPEFKRMRQETRLIHDVREIVKRKMKEPESKPRPMYPPGA